LQGGHPALRGLTGTSSKKQGPQSRWREIGIAYRTDNETITVRLDALPVNGTVVLVAPREEKSIQLER